MNFKAIDMSLCVKILCYFDDAVQTVKEAPESHMFSSCIKT